jgi:DNA mismatch repair ATPase MutS
MNSNLDHLLNLPQTTVISSEKVSDFYLLQLQLTNKGVSCPHCREYSDTLHQVQPGGASKSYGIEAGRLAGLPPTVISRARQVMSQIEEHSKIALGLRESMS